MTTMTTQELQLLLEFIAGILVGLGLMGFFFAMNEIKKQREAYEDTLDDKHFRAFIKSRR